MSSMDSRHEFNSCKLFNQVDPDLLKKLSGTASHHELLDGEAVFTEGDPRKKIYLISSGCLEVIVGEGIGKGTSVLLRSGEVLGEAALIDSADHSASAQARGPASYYELNADAMLEIFAGRPRQLRLLLSNVLQIIMQRMHRSSYHGVGWKQLYATGASRSEHDLLGTREVPHDALYGVQTLRAMENFDISGIRLSHQPQLIRAMAMVKLAAVRTNLELGLLEDDMAAAIATACQEIIDGHWHGHFTVDLVQGGAGTSTNMNANEVIANRALELMGHARGDYQHCHPNNHVNLSQSTNDVYPSAVRVAVVLELEKLLDALQKLHTALEIKAAEFAEILKMGRTQLQDAVPMTLAQEFGAFATTTVEDIDRLRETSRLFLEINLGGTAIGTGINADPRYPEKAVQALAAVTGLQLSLTPNLVEATPDTGAFVMFSGVLKRVAVKLSKLCNDLRLLSSGPRAGINEINLPPMQPGSSIMPGKVNPVIPEVVNQVAFQVIGNDLTITMAAEAGQLQLNVMEPMIAFKLF